MEVRNDTEERRDQTRPGSPDDEPKVGDDPEFRTRPHRWPHAVLWAAPSCPQVGGTHGQHDNPRRAVAQRGLNIIYLIKS